MALSYSTAARIAARELRHSRGKFFFVVLSVAIGVAALTGVRGFSSAFRAELLLRARSILSADLAARTTQAPTPDEQAALDKFAVNGTQSTQVTELLSMASSTRSLDPLLVAIKAVDPVKYPFYGDVKLAPQMPLPQALTDSTVAVGDDLLLRLHLSVGDSIKLGSSNYRIVAVVEDEPDRLSGMFAAGPRVLLSQSALAETGLLAPGSHATRRYLFKLTGARAGQVASDDAIAALKPQLESLLPEANVQDYRDANTNITRALDGATGLLSLMSLVALVLGAVGVAMAMRAHLAQKLDTIAIMKSLGARSGQIMKIYLLQTLLIGLCGGVLGLVLGIGVQLAFPFFLAKLLHVTPALHIDWRAFLMGLSAGLLTTLLFTLPPLLDIRDVRPILILRRAVEVNDDPFAMRLRKKLEKSAAQLVAILVILGGLLLLAWRVSDSIPTGIIFTLGLALVLAVLLLLSWATLRLLRAFLTRTRLGLPSSVRHGLANLYRPGNPSAALLAALGLGVMQIAAVYIVQRSIVNEMQVATAERLPNIFLIDMTSDEVDGVRSLLAAQASVQGTPEILPVAGARIVAVDGKPLADLNLPHMPRNAMRNVNLTASPAQDAPPPGDKVVSGAWWTAQQAADSAAHPLVAIGDEMAKRLHAYPGQQITLAAADTEIVATIAATFKADDRHAFSRAGFVVPSVEMQGLPVVWYGGVHCDPNATAQLRRALYEKFPTVTVIDVAATLELVRQIILQVTFVIQFLAAFSIFAGIVILASAIAGTRYRRIREVVVLKTLGATRPRIATIFSIEFAVLGLIAGFVGLVFANLLGRILLLHRFGGFDYHFQPMLTLLEWLGVAALTVVAGWLASHRVLGQKPLEILREE